MRARIQIHRSTSYAARVLALAVAVLCVALPAPAQTTTEKPSATTARATKHRKPHATAKPATAAPAVPAQPPAPNWPVNSQPAHAAVTWDGRGLRIDAANSSLLQILADVTAATGAKIEGTTADQRVFGIYGPGSARDVLSQLLQGSGYNIVMMGENGQGVPREVVLSQRNAGSAAPPAMAARPQPQPDDDIDDTPEPQMDTPLPPPQPSRPGGDAQENQQRPQQTQPGLPPTTQPNN